MGVNDEQAPSRGSAAALDPESPVLDPAALADRPSAPLAPPGTRWHIALEGSDWRLPLAGLQTVEALQHFGFDARLAARQANEPKPGEQSASDPARRRAGAAASGSATGTAGANQPSSR